MITNVTTAEQLKDLYDKWAMTWEGLREEDFEEAMNYCGGEGVEGYLIKGKDMNDICHLSGSNAYPEDLNIFAIYPFKGLAMMVGARWMYDIIENNAHREGFHPFKNEDKSEE